MANSRCHPDAFSGFYAMEDIWAVNGSRIAVVPFYITFGLFRGYRSRLPKLAPHRKVVYDSPNIIYWVMFLSFLSINSYRLSVLEEVLI
jgi:hypothetical protein